jgi:polyamine oxidase
VPPLPPATAAAVLEFPMALYSKLFFRFPWKFWQEEQMLLSAYGNGEFAPVWQSLDMAGFLPGSNILFLTVTGERARELQLRPNTPAADTQIINELLPVLNQIFPAAIAAKTGGRALRRADVLEFSMARWLQDDLARGMYSNWRVNRTWEEQEPTRANIGRLWLSGEHTCFRYNGYVHGAFLAGRRTANLLLARDLGRSVDLATTCDQSPAQLTGASRELADADFPHSAGFPRPHADN